MATTTPVKKTEGSFPSSPATPLQRMAVELFGKSKEVACTPTEKRGSDRLQALQTANLSEKHIFLPGSEKELSLQITEALSKKQDSCAILLNLLQSLIPETSNVSKILGRSICKREIGIFYRSDALLHRHFITESHHDLGIAYELTLQEKDDESKISLFYCLMNQYEEIKAHIDSTSEAPYSILNAQEKYLQCQKGLEFVTESLNRKTVISKLKIFKIFTSSLGVLLLVIYSRKVLKNYRIKKLS